MKLPSKKDYPKTINVGDEVYTIKFVKKVDEDKDTYGECDPETRVIKIRESCTVPETFGTFIHEVIHAIEFEYDLTIPHPLVHKLDRALTDFFLSNF